MIPDPSSSMVGSAVIIGIFLFSGVSTIISLLSLFATRRETDALKDSLAALETKTRATTTTLYEKLSELERGVRGEFREDVGTLQDEISKATSGVASLTATVNLLNQSLAAAHARLDRLAERKEAS